MAWFKSARRLYPLLSTEEACIFKHFPLVAPYLPIRAIYGPVEPFTGLGGRVRLSLSSTWGRADQQTSHDSLSLGRFVLREKRASGRVPPHLPPSRLASRLSPVLATTTRCDGGRFVCAFRCRDPRGARSRSCLSSLPAASFSREWLR
jgi:hypothetical protein